MARYRVLCSWRRIVQILSAVFSQQRKLLSHLGVPPPRVLLIDHSLYRAVAAALWKCHKMIYKNAREGYDSGAKNHQSLNPPSLYTPFPSSSRSLFPVIPISNAHYAPQTTCTPDRTLTRHTRSWTGKMKSPRSCVATIPTRNGWR